MPAYSIRDATTDEQRELTRLCVRATMQAGYDQAFIDRAIPGLTVTLPLITAGCVQVAEHKPGEVLGVVMVAMTGLQGIALLHGLYVDPPSWKRGVGRVLFEAAIARTKALKAGVLVIYAEPSAEGFYKRMGATRVGEGTFYYSPEIVLPQLLYILPREAASHAVAYSMSRAGAEGGRAASTRACYCWRLTGVQLARRRSASASARQASPLSGARTTTRPS
jgi:GNAT superfamily N-acetyltransferase